VMHHSLISPSSLLSSKTHTNCLRGGGEKCLRSKWIWPNSFSRSNEAHNWTAPLKTRHRWSAH
jgi:hypothetical protein